jgi:hypothetical protein
VAFRAVTAEICKRLPQPLYEWPQSVNQMPSHSKIH